MTPESPTDEHARLLRDHSYAIAVLSVTTLMMLVGTIGIGIWWLCHGH